MNTTYNSNQVRSEGVTYVPHHGTLTDSGQSQFSRVSDALCEFVDNSIQASSSVSNTPKDNDKPTVNIDILLESKTESAMLIRDSGEGMDIERIRAFATYSLSRETRGLSDQADHGNISRFGVGAKQGGFYLGDRISVITKKNDSNDVIEFSLDRQEFERRYNTEDEEVYKDNAYIRPKSDINNSTILASNKLSEKLKNICIDHENQNESFCIIMIILRSTITRLLENDQKLVELSSELSNTYHMYLHPEHLPDNVASLDSLNGLATCTKALPDKLYKVGKQADVPKFENESGSVTTRKFTCKRTKNFERDLGAKSYELKVTGYKNGKQHTQRELSKEGASISQFFSKACQCLRFDIKMPNPTLVTKEIARNILADQNSSRSATYPEYKEDAYWIEARVLLLYYPFKNGESRPSGKEQISPSSEEEEDVAVDSENTNDFGSSTGTSSDLDKDVTFSVFWANRLVPEERINDIHLFPERNSLKNFLIPEEWRDRIKGFLFFSNEFGAISNNKLKFTMNPPMRSYMAVAQPEHRYLKELFKVTTCNHYRSIQEKNQDELQIPTDHLIKNWLGCCFHVFDRTYKYYDLMVYNSPEYNHIHAHITYNNKPPLPSRKIFKTMKYKEVNRVQAEDLVKIYVTKNGKQGAFTTQNECFVKVLGFCALDDVKERSKKKGEDNEEYSGRANLIYAKIPENIYGPTDLGHVEVQAIHFVGRNHWVVTDAELRRKESNGPVNVQIFRKKVKDTEGGGSNVEKLGDGTDEEYWEDNVKFFMLGVQILDGRNHPLFFTRTHNRVDWYTVVLHMKRINPLDGDEGKIKKVMEQKKISREDAEWEVREQLQNKRDRFIGKETAIYTWNSNEYTQDHNSLIHEPEALIRSSCYSFWNVPCPTDGEGRYKMWIEVMLQRKTICTFEAPFEFKVLPALVEDFEISNWPDPSDKISLGEKLPFGINFINSSGAPAKMDLFSYRDVDDNGAVVTKYHPRDIQLKVTCPQNYEFVWFDEDEDLTQNETLVFDCDATTSFEGIESTDFMIRPINTEEVYQFGSQGNLMSPLNESIQLTVQLFRLPKHPTGKVDYDHLFRDRGLELGVAKEMHLNITSGKPHRLNCAGADLSGIFEFDQVQNGTELEKITLALSDLFNYPADGTGWKCKPDYGNKFSGPRSMNFDDYGRVEVTGVVADVNEHLSAEGENFSIKFTAKKKGYAVLHYNFSVRVVPEDRPESLSLELDDIKFDSDVVRTCGTSISGLTINVLDQHENTFDVSTLRNHKSSRTIIKRDGEQLCILTGEELLIIPDLELPTTMPSDRNFTVFEVEMTLGSQCIRFDFDVSLQAEAIYKWKMCLDYTLRRDKFLYCDDIDLYSKVIGVYAVDMYGNVTDVPESMQPPKLLLEYDAEYDDAVQENTAPISLPLTLSSTYLLNHQDLCEQETLLTRPWLQERGESYQLVNFFSLEESVDQLEALRTMNISKRVLRLEADVDSTIAADDHLEFELVAGPPQHLHLTIPSLGVEQPTKEAEISVTPHQELNDLHFHLTDSKGNPANDKFIRSTFSKALVKVQNGNNFSFVPAQPNFKNVTNADFDVVTKLKVNSYGQSGVLLTCIYKYKFAQEDRQCEATLNCKLLKLNLVEKIDIKFPKTLEITNDMNENGHGGEQMEVDDDNTIADDDIEETPVVNIKAGDAFPSFLAKACTQDGLPYLMSEECISYRFKCTEGGPGNSKNEWKHLQLGSSIYAAPVPAAASIVDNVSEGEYTLHDIQNGTEIAKEFKYCGTYDITLVYEEKRPDFLSLPKKQRIVTQNFSVICAPGDAQRLKLNKFSVQNCSVSNKGTRLVDQRIEAFATDHLNYPTQLPVAWRETIVCTLKWLDTQDHSKDDLPLLEGSVEKEIEGEKMQVVESKYDAINDIVYFDALSILEDSGTSDGKMQLLFFSIADSSISIEISNLEFTRDVTRAQKVSTVQAQLTKVSDDIRKYNARRDQNSEELQQLIRSIKNELLEEGLNNMDASSLNAVTAEAELKKAQDSLAQLDKAPSSSNSRGVKMHKQLKNKLQNRVNHGRGFLGAVVELGKVENEIDALLVSWLMKPKMDAFVFKSYDDKAKECFRQKTPVWPVDGIKPFKKRVRATNTGGFEWRERNDDEREQQRLFLHRSNGSSQGSNNQGPSLFEGGKFAHANPVYMVDIIVLDKQYEHLRDTVFYSTIRGSVIVDTNDQADAYRTFLRKNRPDDNIPWIYSRDGYRISPDNYRDPRSGYGKLDRNSLDYVFGAPEEVSPVQAEEQTEALQRKVIRWQEIMSKIKERDRTVAELKEIDGQRSEFENWQKQEVTLNSQLRAMNQNLSTQNDNTQFTGSLVETQTVPSRNSSHNASVINSKANGNHRPTEGVKGKRTSSKNGSSKSKRSRR